MKKENNENVVAEEIVVAEESTEVVTQGSTELAQTSQRIGFEKTDMTTIKLAVAKLLQSNSPEVVEEDFEEYGFKAGRVIHSVLLDDLTTPFVPIMVYNDNVMFVPKNDAEKKTLADTIFRVHQIEMSDEEMNGQMIICRANDGKHGDKFGDCSKCALNKFHGAEKPVCNANLNILALFDGQVAPVVIRFTSTSFKHGEKFKQLAYYAGGNLFDRKYRLSATKKSGNGNTWYELTVRPSGVSSPEEVENARRLHTELSGIIIETEAPEEHEVASTPPPVTAY